MQTATTYGPLLRSIAPSGSATPRGSRLFPLRKLDHDCPALRTTMITHTHKQVGHTLPARSAASWDRSECNGP